MAKYLISSQTDLVGTIRKTSRGFPRIDTIRLGQGENIKLTNDDGIIVRRWVDKRDVYSLSTITAGDNVDFLVSRFNTTSRKLKPAMLLYYSKYMGGVDKLDQEWSYYNNGRKCRKYWKYILYNVFNIYIINSYILFKKIMQIFPIHLCLILKTPSVHRQWTVI